MPRILIENEAYDTDSTTFTVNSADQSVTVTPKGSAAFVVTGDAAEALRRYVHVTGPKVVASPGNGLEPHFEADGLTADQAKAAWTAPPDVEG